MNEFDFQFILFYSSIAFTVFYILPSYILIANSDIRMVNGNSSNEGKVEIKHNGQWGDICDTGIDTTDAKVFCRMLGYDSIR